MKTVEDLKKEIKALKVLLEMSEAHKQCLIATHEAEKRMLINAKSNFVNGVFHHGEYIVSPQNDNINKTED